MNVTVRTHKENRYGVSSPDVGEMSFDAELIATESIGVGKYRNRRQGSLVVRKTYRAASGVDVLVEEIYQPYTGGRLTECNLFVDGRRVVFLNGKACNDKLVEELK